MHTITVDQRKLYSEIDDNSLSRRDTARLLLQTGEAFGFKTATLMVMPAKTDMKISNLIIESSLAKDFFLELDEVGPPRQSACYDAARNTTLPVTWSAEQLVRQSELMNAASPAYMDIYLKNGLSCGVLFPVFTLDGSRHIVRYDGIRPELEQRELNDLFMLTMHIFQAYDRARYPLPDNPADLTEREVEIVRWTATGKSSSEIGVILSLSDHTVNAYLNNAIKKLDCVNRVQLVAKALRMRIIA